MQEKQLPREYYTQGCRTSVENADVLGTWPELARKINLQLSEETLQSSPLPPKGAERQLRERLLARSAGDKQQLKRQRGSRTLR